MTNWKEFKLYLEDCRPDGFIALTCEYMDKIVAVVEAAKRCATEEDANGIAKLGDALASLE